MDSKAGHLPQTHRRQTEAGQYDLMAFFSFNADRNPLVIETCATMPCLRLNEITVADNADRSFDSDRPPMALIRFCAHIQLNKLANTYSSTFLNRIRIIKDYKALSCILG